MSRHAIFAFVIRVFIAGRGITGEGFSKARVHTLTCDCAVKRVTFDEQRLARTATVRLQDIDSFDRVLDVPPAVDSFDREHSIDGHGSKKIVVTTRSQFDLQDECRSELTLR